MDLSDWLVSIEDRELSLFSDALNSRRLQLDATATQLRSYGWPEHWETILHQAKDSGLDAYTLNAMTIVARKSRSGAGAPKVSLVCTKPSGGMAEVVDTAVVVRQLFTQAKREVLVAGFRIHDREMLEPLRRNVSQALDIRIFVDIDPAYTASGGRQGARPLLSAWPSIWWEQFVADVWPANLQPPRCWYAPSTLGPDSEGAWRSMHAKSVIIDRRFWFVTSANFTRRGHERNIEVGVLIEDPKRATEVIEMFENWVGAGIFVPVLGAI